MNRSETYPQVETDEGNSHLKDCVMKEMIEEESFRRRYKTIPS